MSFDFGEQLNKGKAAADDVIENRKEIKAVLKDLEGSLKKFLGVEVECKEFIEFKERKNKHLDLQSIVLGGYNPREKTGFTNFKIINNETEIDQEIFKIKRSKEIYPITIATDNNRFVSDNQAEFVEAIGEVVADSQVHLLFKSFLRRIEEKQKDKPEQK